MSLMKWTGISLRLTGEPTQDDELGQQRGRIQHVTHGLISLMFYVSTLYPLLVTLHDSIHDSLHSILQRGGGIFMTPE